MVLSGFEHLLSNKFNIKAVLTITDIHCQLQYILQIN